MLTPCVTPNSEPARHRGQSTPDVRLFPDSGLADIPKTFVYVVCQTGSESTLKSYLMSTGEPFRLAFSRPGLLTFKVAETEITDDSQEEPAKLSSRFGLPPEHWLIRQSGFGLGHLRDGRAEVLVARTLELAGRHWDAIHVFSRDTDLPGNRGFEPGENALCQEIESLFRDILPGPTIGICGPQKRVLDVIVVQPDQWLIGCHWAQRIYQRWPGGVFPVRLPAEVISRAYLKTAEAVAWSQLPFQSGDELVEIGSSPGGASQRFLDMGLKVTGIDPAEMHPLVLQHPGFTHWRGKSSGIKRKLYRRFRWLSADANVAPNYTLDAVEDIVTYPSSRLEGLLLTLKLSNYGLAGRLDEYISRVRGWGYPYVKIRQLATNRRECCLAASRVEVAD